MSFKIVPWLLVLSITFAYAFPSAQHDDEDDPNHVHDEHCTHPIKEAFNKVKTSISNAYQKTKQTIGTAYTNIKNSFKKTDGEKKPDVPPSSQGNEGTDQSGSVNPGRNEGSSLGGNDNTGSINGGSSGVVDDNNNGSSSVSGSNPSATSNIGDNTGNQQGSPSDSEVESLIDVRFRDKQKKN